MLAIDVINLLAAEGAYSASVTEQLERSEVWQAYSRQKHDLFLPAAGNAQVRGATSPYLLLQRRRRPFAAQLVAEEGSCDAHGSSVIRIGMARSAVHFASCI